MTLFDPSDNQALVIMAGMICATIVLCTFCVGMTITSVFQSMYESDREEEEKK